MLEPWCDASILPPPVNMFLCIKKVDISTLKHVFNNIIKVLSKQAKLHMEGAYCSRFVYKFEWKFSKDIGYRYFKKVHSALKKYLALNLLKDIESFLCALPSAQDDDKYLPTRQMLEYVMLRIITFSKILLRVCVCSKQAAIFSLNRISRGESHWMSMSPFALLCSIWSLSMELVQHSTSWYSNLYPFLNVLQHEGLPFLPDKYELPQDLGQWLDLKNIDDFGRFNWHQRKSFELEKNLLEDDDNDLFDSIMNFVNDVNKNESDNEFEEECKPITYKDQFNSSTALKTTDHEEVLPCDDFAIKSDEAISKVYPKLSPGDKGESLSRERFKILLSSENKFEKKHPDKQQVNGSECNKTIDSNRILNSDTSKNIKSDKNLKHSHKKITNSNTLKKFIQTEEKFRDDSDSRSLTAHLSFMQWHALRKALLKLCDIATNRKIDKKFQKIWKEKCLDYNI